MTQEQKQVKDWMLAFDQECPEKPIIPSLEVRLLRAKLIYEEAQETIQALGCLEIDGKIVPGLKESKLSLAKIADGCEDLKVVTEGTLVACGLAQEHDDNGYKYIDDTDPLFNEVMRSNWSKTWNSEDLEVAYPKGLPEGWTHKIIAEHPEIEGVYSIIVKDSSGKVIKSPSYSPANLQPIIDSLNT